MPYAFITKEVNDVLNENLITFLHILHNVDKVMS